MAAYGHVLADPRVQLDDRRRRAVAAAVGTARYARTLRGRRERCSPPCAHGPVGQALRPGARAVFLAVPVAYRMLSYDGSTAVIKSWGVAITASDTGLSPAPSWGTTTTTARLGARRLEGRPGRARRPGPLPAGPAAPSSVAAFIDALAGMRTLRHAP